LQTVLRKCFKTFFLHFPRLADNVLYKEILFFDASNHLTIESFSLDLVETSRFFLSLDRGVIPLRGWRLRTSSL